MSDIRYRIINPDCPEDKWIKDKIFDTFELMEDYIASDYVVSGDYSDMDDWWANSGYKWETVNI